MKNFNFSRGRLPVVPVLLAFGVAFLLDFIPLPASGFFWVPKFSAIVLFFLAVNRPQTFGMFSAFLIGLLVDAGTATPLGQHALAYVAAVFLLQLPACQNNLNTPVRQTAGALLTLLFIQAVLLFVYAVGQRQLVYAESLVSAVSGMLLWPLADRLLKNLFARFSK